MASARTMPCVAVLVLFLSAYVEAFQWSTLCSVQRFASTCCKIDPAQSSGPVLGSVAISRALSAKGAALAPGGMSLRASRLQMVVDNGDRVQKILPLYDGTYICTALLLRLGPAVCSICDASLD